MNRPAKRAATLTPTRSLGLAAGALLGVALWWRRNPSACPYNQRFWVQAPHPLITRRRLRDALGPVAGRHVLEVGPGTGYYTLPVAEWIGPQGRLDIVDVQQAMLDHTDRRARDHGLSNVHPLRGDAQALPYPDQTFDATFLVTALGEIPDQVQALRELRRVTKLDGRVVVGELWGDPHVVTAHQLRRRARQAGLRWQERVGPFLGFFAVLRPIT